MDEVSRIARLDGAFAERLAELRDVDLERGRRGRRRVFAPELVDQAFSRHDAAGVQREDGEKGALLPTADLDRPAAAPNLDGPEHAVIHTAVLALA